jgi:hypothetical protein
MARVEIPEVRAEVIAHRIATAVTQDTEKLATSLRRWECLRGIMFIDTLIGSV